MNPRWVRAGVILSLLVLATAVTGAPSGPDASPQYTQGYDDGYRDGYANGSADGYATGYGDAFSAGYASGRSDGYDVGYANGSADGYASGYRDAYADGYQDGLDAGAQEAFDAGYAAGYENGSADGFESGYVAGHADGYSQGFDAGFGSGFSQGYEQGLQNGTGPGGDLNFTPAGPHPALACSEPYHIQWAGWDFCWQQDDLRVQGLEINRAFFHNESVVWKMGMPFSLTRYDRLTGPGPFKDVLGSADEAGVPGFGRGSLPLTADSCPRFFGAGTLLNDGHTCLELRGGANPAVALWARYDLYNYRFLQGWTFDARGSVEPLVAMGGHLIDDTGTHDVGAAGMNHQHHIYWRVDFDIAADGNDTLQVFKRLPAVRAASPAEPDLRLLRELTESLGGGGAVGDCEVSPGGGTPSPVWCDILLETRLIYQRETSDKWRVLDRFDTNGQENRKSFEFSAYSDSPADDFSTFDVLLLQYKGDSTEIGHEVQQKPALGDSRAMDAYMDREEVTDPVAWVALHAYHETRDEDRGSMTHRFVGFTIQPNNFLDENPGEVTYP